MRIEELENNLYIKSADSIEKYLLNIIQEYFKDSNTALEGSKEYIIKEAVDRLRAELDYNSLGVLSIELPNGEIRKGDVKITLEDLNAEPLISPKLSAFNVNFGNKPGTACEGNDPRLYNARMPITHMHETSDIRGLEGLLSTINGLIERADSLNHTHDNKDVLDKLYYTGTNNEIDLTLLDTLEPKIDQITSEIRQSIEDYITNTQTDINTINEDLLVINQSVDEIYQYVLDKCTECLTDSKEYADTIFDQAYDSLKDYIDNNYANKDLIAPLIETARNCYTLVNTDKWDLQNIVLQTNGQNRVAILPLSEITLAELTRRSITIANETDILFNFSIEYVDNNVTYRQPIPFLTNYNTSFAPFVYPLVTTNTISGFIENIQTANNSLKITFMSNENQLPQNILLNGKIICDIYAKPLCTIVP